jgi:hypothetical protein
MADLLFYQKPIPLNKKEHQTKKIKSQANNFKFASKTNSVILAGVEFSEAAKEYPIVFAQAGESAVPVALLGLRNEENLFINEDGSWDAKYIPAFVRRYPFVLADTGESGQRVVCIDEGYAGFNDSEGEPLFEGDEPAPMLKQALEFLEEYQKQYVRTEAFVRRLKENDLLMALNAKIDLVDGQQFGLTGLLAVDERKLLQLADDKALELFRSGELSWIYCHLMSLGSMARMLDRMAGRKVDDGGSDGSVKKVDEKEMAATKAAVKAKAKTKAKPKAD